MAVVYAPVAMMTVPDTGKTEYYYRCICFMAELKLNKEWLPTTARIINNREVV